MAALGLLDTHSGELRLSFAGAEPLLLLREDGGVETQEGMGLPLGIQSGVEYDTIIQHLGPGDTLLLATDGLTEARQDGVALEHTGLGRLLAETREAETLKAQGQAILAHVKAFSGGTLRDDACLLLARRFPQQHKVFRCLLKVPFPARVPPPCPQAATSPPLKGRGACVMP